MARTDEREADALALKAELAELLEHSRRLLAEEDAEEAEDAGMDLAGASRGAYSCDGDSDDDLNLDDLSGIELAFEELEGEALDEEDSETRAGQELTLLDELSERISHNPLLWVAGAALLGFVGVRLFSGSSQNHREKASQAGDFPITHGSLQGIIMKNGFDLAKPVLLKASKEWLSQIVESRR
jgi:hypothetical protein